MLREVIYIIDLLKHFILFYFMLNTIIILAGLAFDSPRELIKHEGWVVFTRVMFELLFFGIFIILMNSISDF